MHCLYCTLCHNYQIKMLVGVQGRAYLLEFRRAEPPSIKRIPEFVEFCRATERDSSYVVPPTMKITTSCGLCMMNNFILVT